MANNLLLPFLFLILGQNYKNKDVLIVLEILFQININFSKFKLF
jgi:hypothetical protein